jgi:hypothetical protein
LTPWGDSMERWLRGSRNFGTNNPTSRVPGILRGGAERAGVGSRPGDPGEGVALSSLRVSKAP